MSYVSPGNAPDSEARRIAELRYLIFKRGGIAGAVRRIVYGWQYRFSAAQVHIEIQRRWPVLVPGEFQVGDCLERMERQRIIQCVLFKHSKIYQRIKNEAPIAKRYFDRNGREQIACSPPMGVEFRIFELSKETGNHRGCLESHR